MSDTAIDVHALQLGERIDLKGFERDDAFSVNPLAFRTRSGSTVVLFRSGTAVFFAMTPLEEEEVVDGLGSRIAGALAERERETVQVVIKPGEEELVGPTGALQLKSADQNRLLLVAAALAQSVSLAWDERRIAATYDGIGAIGDSLKSGRLPPGPQRELLERIGEALAVQHRLAGRIDLDDKPDVLWDHPELERFWGKLVDEYDLGARSRAIGRKLEVIRGTADTITDLIATRTSHRLEWYIIALIAFEIVLGLYDRFLK